MKGDFSRITFDPAKHYTGVLHQQGRVWLDSDWNEDVLERLALMQRHFLDTVGPSGFPPPGTAFQLLPSLDPNNLDNFGISAGHCYVDGILCELEADCSYLTQPDFLDPPRITIPTDGTTLTALVYLDVWQRLITYLEDDSLREVALGGPDTSARMKTVAQVKVALISNPPPNITCAQAAQFLPVPGNGRFSTLQPTTAQPNSLCQLPDPANFTGRENHFYRVQIHDGGDVAGDSSSSTFSIALGTDASAGSTTVSLAIALNQNQTAAALRNAFVTIADNSGASERVLLTSISSSGDTLTLGELLQNTYTVANAATVIGGVARFKWSRDNAAFAVAVTDVSLELRTTLTLASLGRDAATGLQLGDLVEVSDDASELGPARGHLTQIALGPDPDQFTVVLADPIPHSFVLSSTDSPPSSTLSSDRHLVLRRWDGVGDASATYDDTATPGMNLGDGVHIQFSGSDLRRGDYWNFTARSADGSVQAVTNAAPAGIEHHYAALAIATWGPPPSTSPPSSPPAGVAMQIKDCRTIFPSLVNFPQADKGFHVTGLQVLNAVDSSSVELVNDTNVQVQTFGGVDVLCDDAIDPASITRPTCYLTADFPSDPSDQGVTTGYFRVVLAGNLTVTGNTISWRPLPQTESLLNRLLSVDPAERGVLVQLNLRGNFIWSLNDPTSYLDGEAFGTHITGTNNISLALSSGDRRSGGDFSMWFWIVAAPSAAQSITAAPTQIFVGETATLTVTLTAPAPAGSNAVSITSSNASVGPVPSAAIAVEPGANSVSFQVTGSAIGSTVISAIFPPGGQAVSTALVVQALPVLTGQLVLTPLVILIGGSSQGTVTLSGPAPQAGMVVTLASNNVAVATVPASVTVAGGTTSATFTVSGLAAGSSTITATLANVTLPAVITVQKPKETKEKDKDIKDKDKDIKDVISDKVEKLAIVERKVRLVEASPLNGFHTRLDLAMPDGTFGDSASSALFGTGSSSQKVRAFIQPEERPAVENRVLNSDDE